MTDKIPTSRYILRPSIGGYFAIFDQTTGLIARFNDTWMEMLTKDEAVAMITELTRLDREARASTKQ